MLGKIKKAKNLVDLIYAVESLAYYFDLKPYEFWNARFSEISLYCQSHLIKINDDLKRKIDLQEAVTNKLIVGDCMHEKAKLILIRDSYKELYETEEKEQTLEEQRQLLKG